MHELIFKYSKRKIFYMYDVEMIVYCEQICRKINLTTFLSKFANSNRRFTKYI